LWTFLCGVWKNAEKIVFRCLPLVTIALLLPGSVSAEKELSLVEALEMAENHSYNVKAARYDSTAAALAHAGTRSERFPVLSLEAQSFYIDELQSIETPLFSREIGSHENYQADFTLAVPLYTGGVLSGRIKAEKFNSLASGAELESERLKAAYLCRKAYLGVMTAQASRRAAQYSLERLEIINRDVNHLFENGLADSIDLVESELALEKGRQLSTRAGIDLDNASTSLAIMIGLELNENIILSDSLPRPSDPEARRLESPAGIDRPELKKLDYVVDAAEQFETIERGSFIPKVNGFAGYSYGMPNRDWFEQTWNDYFRVGLTVSWQLNLGFKTSRKVREARERAAAARMNCEKVAETFRNRRDVARNNLRLAYRTFLTSDKELELARHRFRLARLRQETGRLSVNRLLEMEAELTAMEQQRQTAVVAYYIAETEYLYAIGSDKIFGGIK